MNRKIFSGWRHIRYGMILLVLLVSAGSCKIRYTLTGASIPAEMETVSVQYFQNRAPIVQPTLSQYITEELKDKLQSQTNLNLVTGLGDANFDGEITNYSTRPQAISGADQAALTRFSVTVKVRFTNTIDPELNFEQSFTHYEDFDSNLNFESVEQDLLEDIIDRITEDIFNRAFVNW